MTAGSVSGVHILFAKRQGKIKPKQNSGEKKRHIRQYIVSGLLTMLAATAGISGFLFLQRQLREGGAGQVPLEVKEKVLTAASMDHSAWILKGQVYTAGEPYADQEAAASWKRLVQVAISDDHLVALDENGMAHAIGENGSNQCLIDGEQGIIYIAAGLSSTVCILADGSMRSYGILNKDERNGIKLEKAAVKVAIGPDHLVVLRKNGTVSAYGETDTGACDTSSWKDVVDIAVGNDYTVGVTRQGTLLYTGNDGYSQSIAANWKNLKQASCGNGSVIGLKENGTVLGTGRNTKGECDVEEWKDVISIASGYDHTIGLCQDGTMVATGYNGSGQCDLPVR